MLLVFTSDELERLAAKFSEKKLGLEFLGANQLIVKVARMSINLTLEEVQPRSLTFRYKMNFFINFLADRFVNLNKPGIIWDKVSDRIHIDFDQLPQDEKTRDFFLRQLIIDDQKMIIDFDLYYAGQQDS